jgi:hypothetical protein
MEMPPLKPFIFVITLLAIFGILVVTIPYGFLAETEEYDTQTLPEGKFKISDLQSYASTWIYVLNETGGQEYSLLGVDADLYCVELEIGGHDFNFIYSQANETNKYVFFEHKYTIWWFFGTSHLMEWINKLGVSRGGSLSGANLEADYDTALPYEVSCSHTHLDVSFDYDEETYSNIEDAWNNHALSVFVGIDFDALATGLNAWDLIGMILFFQTPDVHPILNYMIGVPIWACIAWLSISIIIAIIKSFPFT